MGATVPNAVEHILNSSFSDLIVRGTLFYRVSKAEVEYLSFTNVYFEQANANVLTFSIDAVLTGSLTFTNCTFTSNETAVYGASFAMIETNQQWDTPAQRFLGEVVLDGLKLYHQSEVSHSDVLTLDFLLAANVVVKNSAISNTSLMAFYRAYNVSLQDSSFIRSGATFVATSMITITDVNVTGRPVVDLMSGNTESVFLFYESFPTLSNATVYLEGVRFENIAGDPTQPSKGGVILIPATQTATFSNFNIAHCSFNNITGLYAIKSADDHQKIKATLNWWGAPGGPNDDCNYNKLGSELYWNRNTKESRILFSPWCSTPSCLNLKSGLRSCRSTVILACTIALLTIPSLILVALFFAHWYRTVGRLTRLIQASEDRRKFAELRLGQLQTELDATLAIVEDELSATEANVVALKDDLLLEEVSRIDMESELQLAEESMIVMEDDRLATEVALIEVQDELAMAKTFLRETCIPRSSVEIMTPMDIGVVEIPFGHLKQLVPLETQGGRGAVFQAELHSGNVVIKFPRLEDQLLGSAPEPLTDKVKRANRGALRWELYLLKSFQEHHTFPSLVGFTRNANGECGMVMQKMNAFQPPPDHLKLDFVLLLAKALATLHSHRIMHGDLKPSNLLITTLPKPHVVITDLGDSYFLRKGFSKEPSIFRGTSLYACPTFQSDGYLTRAADIYSLGKTIFEIYTGLLPLPKYFESVKCGQSRTQAVTFSRSNLPRGSTLPTEFDQIKPIISLCLQDTPAKRPDIDYVISLLSGVQTAASAAIIGDVKILGQTSSPPRSLQNDSDSYTTHYSDDDNEATVLLPSSSNVPTRPQPSDVADCEMYPR